ncbi:MAG: ATP-binding cassette domain-containing protein, partial [Oscillospiraceae bacterium]
ERKALCDINLDIEQGEYLVVFGQSGSGKSTLLKHLKPSLTPFGQTSGEIVFAGENLLNCPLKVTSAQIGFVMQNLDGQIVTDKVWHELAFGLENLGTPQGEMRLRVAEMANFFGIEKLFHSDVNTLSGGQKQLLNLASIMVMQPKVLILDEPTSQLDPIAAVDFLNTVKRINLELGTTVIISEHRLEAVFAHADRVIFMENGRIATQDSPRRVGEFLFKNKDDMFCALPSPMQIFYGMGGGNSSPLSVKECRDWFKKSLFSNREIKQTSLEKTAENTFEEIAIELKDLWFRYEKEGEDILKNVNLQVPKGSLFSIVGGNGAGKTTLLKTICGINKAYSGKVLINSSPIKKYRAEINKLSMLPQDPTTIFAYNNVLQELTEMLTGADKEKQDFEIQNICSLCQIEDLLFSHPFDLSGGEQQRVALAKILLTKPEILLLDEPTKGMDSLFKKKFAKILKDLTDQKVTVLLISHDVEFCAQYSDLVGMFFDGGVLCTLPPREFFSQNSFYTTAASRISRNFFKDTITNEEVIELCKINLN